MIKVITYGTYDLLHYGHIRLLERAKELGDYLIVGVTSDDFDRGRGKINVQQTLMERVKAVKDTGIADQVIVEEYEGQKIDDIRRYGVDIFAVGSDWEGKFDYLNSYCKVVYLPRTEGVSSSEIRKQNRKMKIGIVGETNILKKFADESEYVNGCEVVGVCSQDDEYLKNFDKLECRTKSYSELLKCVDAVYIASHPSLHFSQIKEALENGKHVLCESPIALDLKECAEAFDIAERNGLILMDAIKTAYSTAYSRMLLLAESGAIGKIVSVDAVCTSLRNIQGNDEKFFMNNWSAMCAWAPTAMLPVFQLLGVGFKKFDVVSSYADKRKTYDVFSKINFVYDSAVASVKVGNGVKSEGELVISGTNGYIYVPAPWWKTDYFEIRYENQTNNKRYFYQLNGEGIRYEIVAFMKSIERKKCVDAIPLEISENICRVISEKFVTEINF